MPFLFNANDTIILWAQVPKLEFFFEMINATSFISFIWLLVTLTHKSSHAFVIKQEQDSKDF